MNTALYTLMGLGIGVIIVLLLIGVPCYVLYAISHMKALKALGYNNAWLAWIPYGCNFACADSVCDGQDNVMMFGKFELPSIVFKLWWIAPLVLILLPLNPTLESIINLALNIVFLGCTYAKMYARLEGKTEQDTQAIGCFSGFLPIIAVVKFFCIK